MLINTLNFTGQLKMIKELKDKQAYPQWGSFIVLANDQNNLMDLIFLIYSSLTISSLLHDDCLINKEQFHPLHALLLNQLMIMSSFIHFALN